MRSIIDSLTENAFTAMVNTTKLCYALHLNLAPSSSLSSSVFCNHMCFALAFAISRIPRTTHPTPPPPHPSQGCVAPYAQCVDGVRDSRTHCQQLLTLS